MNNQLLSTPGEHSDNSFSYVPRNYRSQKKITLEIAEQQLSNEEHGKNGEEKLFELQDIKNNCRDMFKYEIERMMMQECMIQDISYNTFSNKSETINIVKTIAQLKKAISQNNDMKFFNKLFRVMYGVFDEQYKWSKNLEKTFMTKYNYKYAEKSNSKHNERGKGCFERIAHDVKTQIVKEL